MIVPHKNSNNALSKQKSVPEIKPSSIIGLITNFKRKTSFRGDLQSTEAEEQQQIYLKVANEEFFIDLEKNEILADLFSDKEMASMVKDLIVNRLKLETNLRVACMHLNKEESAILNLKARGHADEKLSREMELSISAIAIHKQNICRRLNKANFAEVLSGVGAKAIYSK